MNISVVKQATLKASQPASSSTRASQGKSPSAVDGTAVASDHTPPVDPSASNEVDVTELDYGSDGSDRSSTLGLDSQPTQMTQLLEITQVEDDDKEEGASVPLHEMSLYLRVCSGEFRSACDNTDISRFFDKDDERSITMPEETSRVRSGRIPRNNNPSTGVETTRKPGYMTDRLMDLIQNAVMVSGHCY